MRQLVCPAQSVWRFCTLLLTLSFASFWLRGSMPVSRASGASRGRLEATAAELTGAVSITATKMVLQVRMPPHLAHLHDLLTLPSAGGMMRGEKTQGCLGPESRPLGSALRARG